MWETRTETAKRIRQRIEAILDFSTAHGWRSGENCARWKGHLENVLPKAAKMRRIEHFAAVDWREMAPFMARLREQTSVGALALRFAILTACRTNEVLAARWDEVNMKDRVWTIPEGTRTKNHAELRVPLSSEALDVLAEAGQLADGSEFIFPGAHHGRPLSAKAMLLLLNRMGIAATVHGTCRATFKTWASETGKPVDITEAALNHTQGKLNEAYQRGDLLTRRSALMGQWASWCCRPLSAEGAANVVTLHQAAASAQDGEAEAAALHATG